MRLRVDPRVVPVVEGSPEVSAWNWSFSCIKTATENTPSRIVNKNKVSVRLVSTLLAVGWEGK
jgi:hypothetical protein